MTFPLPETVATASLFEAQETVLSVASAGETVAVRLMTVPYSTVVSVMSRDTPVTGTCHRA